MHNASHEYFKLPVDQKMECYMGNAKQAFRGYTPLLGSHQTTEIEENPAGNLSEAFDIGYELEGDKQAKPGDVLPEDTASMYGGNIWPKEEYLPGFRSTYNEYFGEVMDLGRNLLRVFALALSLPESYFDEMVTYPGSLSRLMYYPPQRVSSEAHQGINPHTDYECFTILSQDSVPGLQVLNANNQWIAATPIKGTFVVNIGDTLKFWTNGKFKSTIHRAINLTGKERYSVPFFFGVNYDAVIKPLDTCIDEGESNIHEPVTAGEYVKKALSTTYVKQGDEVPDLAAAAKMVEIPAPQMIAIPAA